MKKEPRYSLGCILRRKEEKNSWQVSLVKDLCKKD